MNSHYFDLITRASALLAEAKRLQEIAEGLDALGILPDSLPGGEKRGLAEEAAELDAAVAVYKEDRRDGE